MLQVSFYSKSGYGEESSKDDFFDAIQSIIEESLEINKIAREVAAACKEQGLKMVQHM